MVLNITGSPFITRKTCRRYLAILLTIVFFTFIACGGSDDDDEPVNVTFTIRANGSTRATTTALTLTFSRVIPGLSAGDISLSGVYGVSKGTLSGTGPAYTLPISGFSSGGALNVAVVKSGYVIKGSPSSVYIYYFRGTGGDISADLEEIASDLADAPGGVNTAAPATLFVDIPLGVVDTGKTGWQELLDIIEKADKFIKLDLSYCDMTGTEFDPVSTISTGKSKIVELILPDAAVSIKNGTETTATFNNFTRLVSVEGAYVETIGGNVFRNRTTLKKVNFRFVESIGNYAFYGCNVLESVSLPRATSIGTSAFYGCSALESVSLPRVASIGASAFNNCSKLYSVTLGASAPRLGRGILDGIGEPTFIIVKVPSGAAGYSPASSPFSGISVTVSGAGTNSWGNGFRGMGWNGAEVLDGTVNTYINLTIMIDS